MTPIKKRSQKAFYFYSSHGKQRGMVLLLVLMIFALAAIIASELSYESHREVRRTANILHSNDSYLLARAGETFAIQKLLADQDYDTQAGMDVDDLEEIWSVEEKAFEDASLNSNSGSLATGQLVQAGFLDADAGNSNAMIDQIGKLTIVIEDLQARFNINNVQYNTQGQTKGDDQLNFVLIAVLKNGVQSAQSVNGDDATENVADDFNLTSLPEEAASIQLDVSPADLALALKDWSDSDDDSILATGAEDDFYAKRDPPHRAANQSFVDVSELMAVKGFDQKDFELLNYLFPKRLKMEASSAQTDSDLESEPSEDEDGAEYQEQYDAEGNLMSNEPTSAESQWGGINHYLSALPFPSKINVNTASELVLQALFTEDQAQTIVLQREGSPYLTVPDIFKNLPTIKPTEYQNYINYLSVNSDYFLATSIATIGETSFTLRSKLYREPNGRVRVLSRDFSQ